MAAVAESESGNAAAQQILRDGLDKKSRNPELLYEALASTEWRANQPDNAIKTLELALKTNPLDPQGRLRWILANLLALRKDDGKLLLQIEELKKVGYSPALVQYLNAYYYINIGNYIKARQLLVPLQAIVKQSPELKARVNVLLARCYSQLVEPEMEREAYIRAIAANPNNLPAKLGWINGMINQGDIEGAIKEYRALVNTVPEVRIHLARLLIAANRQRPEAKRNWSEVEELVTEVAKAMPQSVEPVILTVEMRVAQGDFTQARKELEEARSRFPKNIDIWVAQAGIAALNGRLDEARGVLDQAQRELGDRVELQLQRAKLWGQSAAQKGPQVIAALNDLAKSAERFSKDDRRKLLTGLATELHRQQDLEGASRLWTQLAEQDPKNLEIRLTLLDLAFQTAKEEEITKEEITKNIKQIEEIDGTDGVLGRYCQVRYLICRCSELRRRTG